MVKILVVDDEKDIVSIIKEALEHYFKGAEILTAHNGLEAFLLAKSTPLDLIITDYNMPYMTGDNCIKALRDENPHNNGRIPIIFVSGYLPKFKDFFEHEQNVILMDKPFEEVKIIKYSKMLLGVKLKKSVA